MAPNCRLHFLHWQKTNLCSDLPGKECSSERNLLWHIHTCPHINSLSCECYQPHLNLCKVLSSSMTKCTNAFLVVFVFAVTLPTPPLTSPLWHWLELYLKVLKNLPWVCHAFALKLWADSHLRLEAAIFGRAWIKVNLKGDRDYREEFLDLWGIRSNLEPQRKPVDCLGLFLRDIFLHPGQLWVSL